MTASCDAQPIDRSRWRWKRRIDPQEKELKTWEILEKLADAGDAKGLEAFVDRIGPSEAFRAILRLDPDEREKVLTTLSPEDAADLIEEIPDEHASDLIEGLDAKDAASILSEMDVDDQVDVIGDMHETDAEAILAEMAPGGCGRRPAADPLRFRRRRRPDVDRLSCLRGNRAGGRCHR